MRTLGWGLILLGAVFGLIAAHAVRRGEIVDRTVRVVRAREPGAFRNGIVFLGGYAAALLVIGALLLGIA